MQYSFLGKSMRLYVLGSVRRYDIPLRLTRADAAGGTVAK
jgi:hypothetical protein